MLVSENRGVQRANWRVIENNRRPFYGVEVAEDLLFKPVRVEERRDPRTGKRSLTFSGGAYIRAEKGAANLENARLFTLTSKMSCASFSLPAGPYGTCPASNRGKVIRDGSYRRYHEDITEGEYICNYCYAGKGNYYRPAVAFTQVMRLKWVTKTIKLGTFIDQMIEAIRFLRTEEARSRLEAHGISEDYFRIHDSGDFFSEEYYRSWLVICEEIPEVQFWAPTRVWALRPWLQVLQGSRIPANLAVRPSTLTVGARPPMIPGLAAGASTCPEPIPGVRECPAYQSDEVSCASAGCRACWDEQDVPVNYHTH